MMSKFVDKHNLKANQIELGEPADDELKAACEHIAHKVVDGVHHGFAKITIVIEKVQSNRTSITVESGKSFRFVV
jgi:hypothetical protein